MSSHSTTGREPRGRGGEIDFDLDQYLRDLLRQKPHRHDDENPDLARVIIYTRVSREDQLEGLSMDAQLAACRNYAQSRGWRVIREFIEPGRSAYTEDLRKRPSLQEALSMIVRGEADIVLNYSLDRLSRRILITLKIFQLLARCGANLASVTENVDYTTPEGRLFVSMLAMFAEYYSAAIAKHTSKVKEQRAHLGLHNGTPPYGYRPGADGIAVPVENEVPAPILAFETYALGVSSDRDIAVLLSQRGYRTRRGNPFTKDTVSAMLRNPFYAGFVVYKGEILPGKHQPLISKDLFDKVQEIRRIRRTR